ncbi:MAG: hypothetical protein SPL47_09910, partial [Bacteroidales bacterium]|nr:hypothetical protein [Bacteroidales bacterium]
AHHLHQDRLSLSGGENRALTSANAIYLLVYRHVPSIIADWLRSAKIHNFPDIGVEQVCLSTKKGSDVEPL